MHHIIELTLPIDCLYKLDPTLVLLRLNEEIPTLIYCIHDYAWKDYDWFCARSVVVGTTGGLHGAMKVAQSDAWRRGPIWRFRIYGYDNPIQGVVERGWIRIQRQDGFIPDELKAKFRGSLHALKIPGAEISSYQLKGNTKTPV